MLLNHNSNRLKIIDFGLSRYLCEGEECRELLGTPEFVGKHPSSFVLIFPFHGLETNLVSNVCKALVVGKFVLNVHRFFLSSFALAFMKNRHRWLSVWKQGASLSWWQWLLLFFLFQTAHLRTYNVRRLFCVRAIAFVPFWLRVKNRHKHSSCVKGRSHGPFALS